MIIYIDKALRGPLGQWTLVNVRPATLSGLRQGAKKNIKMRPDVVSLLFRFLRIQKRRIYMLSLNSRESVSQSRKRILIGGGGSKPKDDDCRQREGGLKTPKISWLGM